MTDPVDNDSEKKQRFPMDRRSGLGRRSDVERRIQDLGATDGKEQRSKLERRSKLDRRSGVDRRQLNQNSPDQLDHFEQYTAEKSLTKESNGLFSCVISTLKRWFFK